MPRRVLVIESDVTAREEVRRALDGVGIRVELAAGAAEGVERARASLPELVLVGGLAAGDGGLAAVLALRREDAFARVPFVALGESAAERDRALAAGCDGFVSRSLDEAELAAELRAHLAGPREPAEVGAEGRPRAAPLDRRESAFIHDLAHELSTPLTPLAGYIKILQAERLGPLSPQQRKVVESLAAAATKLTRIVDNLADFASLGAGPAAITPSRVDPDAMAEEVVSEAKEAARGARLHIELRPSGGGPVVADARKLRQALANVVQNAVKFSPHGGEVLVEVVRLAGKLRFSVYDQGPGVPAQAMERIFEPLHQSERVGEARLPGSGLGLPVARRIAEAHGGRMLVESPPHSQPGGVQHHYAGSKFVIEIPARVEQPDRERADGQA
jgi:signal transduction histidine kinase